MFFNKIALTKSIENYTNVYRIFIFFIVRLVTRWELIYMLVSKYVNSKNFLWKSYNYATSLWFLFNEKNKNFSTVSFM